jgi:hypothetical protein
VGNAGCLGGITGCLAHGDGLGNNGDGLCITVVGSGPAGFLGHTDCLPCAWHRLAGVKTTGGGPAGGCGSIIRTDPRAARVCGCCSICPTDPRDFRAVRIVVVAGRAFFWGATLGGVLGRDELRLWTAGTSDCRLWTILSIESTIS